MIRKGLWSPEEDEKLKRCISKYENGSWNDIAKKAGLQRCGRSCRQRWLNHLRPGLRKEKFSKDEVRKVMELQAKLGNKWSEIAGYLSGRTDNEVKNLWNTVIKRRLVFSAASKRHQSSMSDSREEDNALLDSMTHVASPPHTTSSQSTSSSTWSLHVSTPDVDLSCTLPPTSQYSCNSIIDHQPYPTRSITFNCPDLSSSDYPLIKDSPNHPCMACNNSMPISLEQEEALEDSCLTQIVPQSPTFELTFPSQSQPPLSIPLLSPPLDPNWNSAAKLVDFEPNASYTCAIKTLEIECAKENKDTFSVITPPTLPSFFPISLSNTQESSPSFPCGHYVKSLLLPPQYINMRAPGNLQYIGSSPHLIDIPSHEDDYGIPNEDLNKQVCQNLSPTLPTTQTSFFDGNGSCTQDIIAYLLCGGVGYM